MQKKKNTFRKREREQAVVVDESMNLCLLQAKNIPQSGGGGGGGRYTGKCNS